MKIKIFQNWVSTYYEHSGPAIYNKDVLQTLEKEVNNFIEGNNIDVISTSINYSNAHYKESKSPNSDVVSLFFVLTYKEKK